MARAAGESTTHGRAAVPGVSAPLASVAVMSQLGEFVDRIVTSGTVPGAVAVRARGDDVETAVAGRAGLDGEALTASAIVRIQSMTKAITAVETLRLVADGRLGLHDSVVPWLPELADRRVLRHPGGPLTEVVPADRELTVHDLLTCTSGYGMAIAPSPLQEAATELDVAAGPEPPQLAAGEWLARLARLPLVGQPGRCWRYHDSFSILGILLSRVTGRSLHEHLRSDLLPRVGMPDTGSWVPEADRGRLTGAYRSEPDGLVELEPPAGGWYAQQPPFDVSHGELVSTAADLLAFARVLAGGRPDVLAPDALAELRRDQVPAEAKTPESFFPGFWDETGWGYGVGVTTAGAHRGRIGWSGGAGTDFFVDPDGTISILLTQVELGDTMWPVLQEFGEL